MNSTEIPKERIQEMRVCYEEGSNLKEVGAAFGISGQRVGQVFEAHGVARRKRGKRPTLNEATQTEVVRSYIAGVSRADLADSHGLSIGAIERVLHSHLSREVISERHRRLATKLAQRDWSDDELVGALRKCARELETESFGVRRYSKWRDRQNRDYPSAPLFHQRKPKSATESGWNEWRKLAGLPTQMKPPGCGAVRFTDDDICAALLRVETAMGHFPSLREYDANRTANEPTAGAIRRRHSGRWGAVRDSFDGWKGAKDGGDSETIVSSIGGSG